MFYTTQQRQNYSRITALADSRDSFLSRFGAFPQLVRGSRYLHFKQSEHSGHAELCKSSYVTLSLCFCWQAVINWSFPKCFGINSACKPSLLSDCYRSCHKLFLYEESTHSNETLGLLTSTFLWKSSPMGTAYINKSHYFLHNYLYTFFWWKVAGKTPPYPESRQSTVGHCKNSSAALKLLLGTFPEAPVTPWTQARHQRLA